MNRHCWLFGVVLIATTVVAAPVLAQEDGMDASAMMEAWQKASTPGEPHAHLATMAGSWKMTVKSFQGPEPTVSEGTSEFEMIFGGRYLKQTAEGSMMGMPYKGEGITGYDNLKGSYFSIWYDNMSTNVFYAVGGADESGKVVTMTAEMMEPGRDAPTKVKTVSRMVSDDEHVFEWYNLMPDGSERMAMMITYTRM